jgi:ribokinase
MQMSKASARPRVTVVGSLNVDYIAAVASLPLAGQTVSAHGLIRRFGGKGANQAIAAARQGASVSLIGCLGADDEGRAYREHLRHEGINNKGISTTDKALTGVALIAVDDKAENMIIVSPGANGELKPAAIRAQKKLIASANVLLLQQEVPLATVVAAIRIANLAKVPVILNPSPLCAGFPWGRHQIDTLITNAGEAESIFGFSVETISREQAKWQRAIAEHGIERLVVTRGAQPTFYICAKEYAELPTLPVKPVDTVGAGDAFAGTYAARRAEGLEVISAIVYANCAGALATLQPGAQEAVPTRAATEKFFKSSSRLIFRKQGNVAVTRPGQM